MKLIYLIPGLHVSGGMERILTNKVNYLVKEYSYEVTIITTEQKGRPPFFKLNPKVKLIDLEINYGDDMRLNFIKKAISFIRKQLVHKKRLREHLLTIKPDVTVSMFGNETSFLCDMPDKSKKFLEIHFSKFVRLQTNRTGIWKVIDFIRTRKDSKAIKKYEKFIVLTNEDKEHWDHKDNILVIPNFVSLNKNAECSSLKNKQVVAVGRISYQKGFDILVESWKIVINKCADWKLVIVGGGDSMEKEKLIKQIKDLKLEESIQLKEPTNNIEKEYLSSSLFVLSSRFEGLPLVLIEAMSFGLPSVAFTCKCGPKDVITSGLDGILVKEINPTSLANAITGLLVDQDKLKELGRNAYHRALQFNEHAIMEKWKNLFEDA